MEKGERNKKQKESLERKKEAEEETEESRENEGERIIALSMGTEKGSRKRKLRKERE